MKFAFKSKTFSFILQNPDDLGVIKSMNVVSSERLFLIKGSGVDLDEYCFSKPFRKKKIICLFPARILKDKGVLEFIEAANIISDSCYGRVEFILAGDCDEGNKAVLHEADLEKLLIPGYITWIRYQKHMIPIYQSCDIVVLPSYREGLPKSLIESCAIGRPIITTNAIGCKECVTDDYNGYKVPIKDASSLAEKILILVNNKSLRLKFGLNARKLAEKEFSISFVLEKTFFIYDYLYKK